MQKIISALRGLAVRVINIAVRLWKRFRSLVLWLQILIAVAILALLIGLVVVLGHKTDDGSGNTARTVTIRSVAELSGNTTGESVIGTVRSRSEAEILSEAGGTVRSVNTSIGASVPAGFVIAELENSSERAAVLQAEGAYDAAIAARASVSPVDSSVAARNAYKSGYATLDTTLTTYIDEFFGNAGPFGPSVLLNRTLTDRDQISRERVAITEAMRVWQGHLATADQSDPATLLTEGETITARVQTLVETLARSANDQGSGATADQLTALATARTSVNTVASSLATARATYRSGSTGSTASVDASVKAALGTLRAAQANLEHTIVRAPIAGTVNFLPIRVGDYVTTLMHVATVAQNGALEIVAYVSEGTRAGLSAGMNVTLEDSGSGVITTIAPALDPVTKQIEIRIAVNGESTLVNGQSVRIGLPSVAVAEEETSTSPIMLPLSSVKLTTSNRVVFTVNTEGKLVAVPVTIGDVRGERIEILSGLSQDARIVTDARGLSEGQQVNIATQ